MADGNETCPIRVCHAYSVLSQQSHVCRKTSAMVQCLECHVNEWEIKGLNLDNLDKKASLLFLAAAFQLSDVKVLVTVDWSFSYGFSITI